jgi:hypothetical protein
MLGRDVATLEVDMEGRDDCDGIPHGHANGEGLRGLALEAGEEFGEQQMAAGQRREVFETLFSGESAGAEELKIWGYPYCPLRTRYS